MENHHIPIKKGLQKDVLRWGLKAKYIMYCLYLGIATIMLGLVLSSFVPMAIALIAVVIGVAFEFLILWSYSRTYGANGFVKKLADASKPGSIKMSNSFKNLLLWKNR